MPFASDTAQTSAQPAGSGEYEVQQGECMNSISQAHGFFWKTLWNHPENAELKQARKDPDVLQPGDRVHIPEFTQREESCATEKLHKFRKKGTPAKLRMQILVGDKPRANEKYKLIIDGKEEKGTLDGDGKLEAWIPPGARDGKLLVGDVADEYPLNFGHIDPIQ